MQNQHHIVNPESRELARQLLDDARVIEQYLENIRALEARIVEYEARFGIPSDQIHEAIENHTLRETEEVCDWIMACEIVNRQRRR